MQLTDDQKMKVTQWIADGLKLSDIQIRLEKECDVRLTYMDVRFLVDDLKLMPKDPPAPPPPVAAEATAPGGAAPPVLVGSDSPAPGGKLSLSVDQIARAGALVSGSVTFGDGKIARWHLDQQGRLGMVPPEPGYSPPQGEIEQFQTALDRELQKLGF